MRPGDPVLELLKKNRDMIFGEVKLTIMIEDPRDVERKRLLGIDDAEDITRDDLVTALEDVCASAQLDVNEGRIPKNRVALKLLAKEMTEWPNLEVESLEKGRPRKSLYAKATDTGVDPQAAKRLNIDWDSAVDIDPEDEDGDGDDIDVPPAVGYGALYLVTALPVIIAVSVVLILFYNSLQ
ncbi:protein CHLOROPLAST ENHANCING STRESS TOLERANCE, chloroplastic-like isoform X3 [Zingiber officinale]|uniref:protein CHLOROPLAST ENHANCING STRESS TOLERANCE, chloroplastic-like isoform X3 n=1 Tax=Zingiber officinale TaxID=94328 RepID=UPI001C4D078A|nr:protein CHLOROPLAST ENHANCING STRESS TOLERANCE, chloroplastic-like isoform X3 [Zingiber officinale]